MTTQIETEQTEMQSQTEHTHTESPEQADLISETHLIIKRLEGMASALHLDFEEKIKYDTVREEMVDRLHAELQEYKEDMIFRIVKPMIMDLIMLYDDTQRELQTIKDEYQKDRKQFGTRANYMYKTLQAFCQDIEDILYRHDVEPFSTDTNIFDPSKQKAISRKQVADKDKHLQIAKRLRKGFTYQEKIIRPEWVDVYAYQSDQD